MPNFASILDQPVETIKPPPLLPTGTYHTILAGLPEAGFSSQKQTPQLKFKHRIIAALEDVDQEELAAAFPDGVTGREVDNILYDTPNSAFMIVDLLKNCGAYTEGKSARACIDDTPNAEVGIFIKHEPTQDGTRMIAKVGRTVALGE